MNMQTVVADEAPLGVLLWPVSRPSAAPNFTLEQVSVVRRDTGVFVVWRYESGATRTFNVGEHVAVQIETA